MSDTPNMKLLILDAEASNYTHWRMVLTALLTSKYPDAGLVFSSKEPIKDSLTKAVDAQLFSMIIISVAPIHLSKFEDGFTGREVYNLFLKLYGKPSFQVTFQLMRRLYGLSSAGGFTAMLQEHSEITQRLASSAHPLSEFERCFSLLNALPPSLQSARLAYEASGTNSTLGL